MISITFASSMATQFHHQGLYLPSSPHTLTTCWTNWVSTKHWGIGRSGWVPPHMRRQLLSHPTRTVWVLFKVLSIHHCTCCFLKAHTAACDRDQPWSYPDFMAVYIADILLFSPTLEQHLHHLRVVIKSISKADPKLNPSKCHFIQSKMENWTIFSLQKAWNPTPNL